MSKTSFLAQLGIAQMGKIGDTIMTSLVKFDPETASAAQIMEMDINCNQLAARVAQAEAQAEKDQRDVQQLQTTLDRNKQAAGILGERLQAAPQGAGADSLSAKLTTVLNEVEQIGGEDGTGASAGTLFEAKQHCTESANDLAEWRQTHQHAVEQMTGARERLRKAHTDMERATAEQQRAEERRRQAERDAGLKQGLDSTNLAMSAMEKAASDARTAAHAATIQTDALRQSSNTSAADIVAEALAAQAPKVSALDRLAKLRQS